MRKTRFAVKFIVRHTQPDYTRTCQRQKLKGVSQYIRAKFRMLLKEIFHVSIVKELICFFTERTVALRCRRFVSGLASRESERHSADERGKQWA